MGNLEFIGITADKGYSLNSYWENPNSATVYSGKTNRIQIAAFINSGDKTVTMFIREPGSNKEISLS